jgi:hypothetical protein
MQPSTRFENNGRGRATIPELKRPQGSCQRGAPGPGNVEIVVGYGTLQPSGCRSSMRSEVVSVGMMNVT